MLNDTQCRTAKPKDKSYKLPDGKGLYLGKLCKTSSLAREVLC